MEHPIGRHKEIIGKRFKLKKLFKIGKGGGHSEHFFSFCASIECQLFQNLWFETHWRFKEAKIGTPSNQF